MRTTLQWQSMTSKGLSIVEAYTGLMDRYEDFGEAIARYTIAGACLEQGLGDFSPTQGGGAQLEEGEGEDFPIYEVQGGASSFPDHYMLWRIQSPRKANINKVP